MQLPYTYTTLRTVICELVKEVIDMVSSLQKKASSEDAHVCFVLDGQPLYAKRQTHKSRSRKSQSSLKAARKLAILFLAKHITEREQPGVIAKFRQKFRACAAGWVRWFPEIKQLIVEEMCAQGAAKGFQPEQSLSVVTAAFEADPKCVELAHRFPRSIIFSNDGDILVYPYADSSVVCFFFFFLPYMSTNRSSN
jgi:5'-3' exonuclease